MKNSIKRLISITKNIVMSIWLFGILLINSCNLGNIDFEPIQNPVKADKKEIEADNNSSAPNEIIVFCGDPGAGKSSLCNSIFQQSIFESGFSRNGIGITQEKQEYIYENRKYIDTPGLSDPKLRKQAAKEIEKALKENNNYKIVFVAMLNSGRIRASDLTTINTICIAIKTPFDYGIIFNQVPEKDAKKINLEGLGECLSDLHKQPSSTIIITRDGDMEGEENKFLTSSSENRLKLIDFIGGLKANMIEERQVQTIDVGTYEKLKKEMELKLSETLKKAEAQRIQLQQQIEQQRLEQQRLEQQRREYEVEQKRKAEEDRLAYQKMLEQQRREHEAEQKRKAEEDRLAYQKMLEQQRREYEAEQEIKLEEDRIAYQKFFEQQRREYEAEQKRKTEEDRLAYQKLVEQQRREYEAEQKRKAEEDKIAYQKFFEQQRREYEAEQKRREEEQRIANQRLSDQLKQEEEEEERKKHKEEIAVLHNLPTGTYFHYEPWGGDCIVEWRGNDIWLRRTNADFNGYRCFKTLNGDGVKLANLNKKVNIFWDNNVYLKAYMPDINTIKVKHGNTYYSFTRK